MAAIISAARRPRSLAALLLAEGLGLAVEHGEVLVVLLEHRDTPKTSEQMMYLCNPHRALTKGVFQERIRTIRAVMGRDAIAGFKTPGERLRIANGQSSFATVDYAISKSGAQQCRDAMERAAASAIDRWASTPDSTPLRTPAKTAS